MKAIELLQLGRQSYRYASATLNGAPLGRSDISVHVRPDDEYDNVPKLDRFTRVTFVVTRRVKLSKHIDTADLKMQVTQKVMTVTEFALQYKITSDEQLRLTRLLGMFATKQEFLMNARLKSRIR